MKQFLFLFGLLTNLSFVNAQELKIKINHQFQDLEMYYDTTYLDETGMGFQVGRFQYYIGHFTLKFDDGSTLLLDDQYILASSNITNYEFFDAGTISNLENLDSIGFYVGVHQNYNHEDPNGYASGHPLRLTNPSMHWGWSAGYRFIAFEGLVDKNDDGTMDKLMEMHITGDNSYFTKVPMVDVDPVADGNDYEIEFICDVYQLLNDYAVKDIGVKHGPSEMHDQMLRNIRGGIVFVDEVLETSAYVDSVRNSADTASTSSILENGIKHNISIHTGDSYAPTIFYNFASTSSVDLEVVDLYGKVVYCANNLPFEGNHFIKKELANGYYFAKFVVENQVYTERFVVQ